MCSNHGVAYFRGGKVIQTTSDICFKLVDQTRTPPGENLVSIACAKLFRKGDQDVTTQRTWEHRASQRRQVVINTLQIAFTGLTWAVPLLLPPGLYSCLPGGKHSLLDGVLCENSGQLGWCCWRKSTDSHYHSFLLGKDHENITGTLSTRSTVLIGYQLTLRGDTGVWQPLSIFISLSVVLISLFGLMLSF